MISIPDMAILGILALLVFGEERLPVLMRQAGRIMRDVQNTSQGFIREMERAADTTTPERPYETPPPDIPAAPQSEPPSEPASRDET
jgi:Sec-independent protein translocase protein TatA